MAECEHDPTLSFRKAMVAGASVGMMEQLAMFPVDNIKTNMQAAVLSYPGNSTRCRRLRSRGGRAAVVVGAIPSHAVIYVTYEFFKRKFGGNQPARHVLSNAAWAGSLAMMTHEAVIAPLDV